MVESFKMKTWIYLIKKRVDTPTDAASVVLLRIVFGLLMFWELVRYYYNGWIRELFVKPQFHFQYEWFQWVRPCLLYTSPSPRDRSLSRMPSSA